MRDPGCSPNVWDPFAPWISLLPLSYLGSVIGLVVGLPLLGYMFFATPHAPTSFRDTAAMTQSGPTPHKIARLRRHKTRQP